MNVLHTTNAKKGPEDAYNAYKEYNDKETDAEIVAAAMEYFGMKDISGNSIHSHLTGTNLGIRVKIS